MRYVSHHPGVPAEICYGLVVADADGIPTRVLSLRHVDPTLCYREPRGDAAVSAEMSRRALAAAETAWLAREAGKSPAGMLETLEETELPTRVKSPVPVTRDQLDAERRVIIGAGLNYHLHQEEVGTAEELLLFPKAVPPRGAHAPVSTGLQIGDLRPRPVLLLDYEVELALVLLEDLDLADGRATVRIRGIHGRGSLLLRQRCVGSGVHHSGSGIWLYPG
jgi:hypothetical protein